MIRIVRYGEGIGLNFHELAHVRIDGDKAYYLFPNERSHTGSISEMHSSSFDVTPDLLQKKIFYAAFKRDAPNLKISMLSQAPSDVQVRAGYLAQAQTGTALLCLNSELTSLAHYGVHRNSTDAKNSSIVS